MEDVVRFRGMTIRQKIIQVGQTKKIFRVQDIDANPETVRKELLRLVKRDQLERVGYGLYTLKGAEYSETQSLVEIAVKAPSAVVCLISALRFHNLTTQNPFEVWIAIPRSSWIPKIETTRTRIFRFAKTVYEDGIEHHFIDGVDIKIYSPAKTIADCFYYQKTVGLDVALEALRDAWRARQITMDELYHFAEVRNVKSTMLPYLATLT